jgi:hypothetical protein
MLLTLPTASNKRSNELKFVAGAFYSAAVLCALDHFCYPDTEYPVNRVSSVYYDTPSLDAYRDKTNGEYLKRKLRLRWYEPVGGTRGEMGVCAYLEVKSKTGCLRQKDRMVVNSGSGWLKSMSLDTPWLQWLHHLYRRNGNKEVSDRLKPVLTVIYDRYRYLCPFSMSRICLDLGIHTDRVNQKMIPSVHQASLDVMVLEVKDCSKFDIPWLNKLLLYGFRQTSFSKYGECLSRVLQGGASE